LTNDSKESRNRNSDELSEKLLSVFKEASRDLIIIFLFHKVSLEIVKPSLHGEKVLI